MKRINIKDINVLLNPSLDTDGLFRIIELAAKHEAEAGIRNNNTICKFNPDAACNVDFPCGKTGCQVWENLLKKGG